MVEVGDIINIISDNENYDEYREKSWEVKKVSFSREDRPGYDEGCGGALIDCEGLPFSLYEYEFEIVE